MTLKIGMHDLIVLDQLVKTGSVSETARVLGLTQSAVSHRMREAEKRLNARLFVKTGRRIGFTGAAERLLLVARNVLAEVERVEQDLEKLSGGYQDVVRLGGSVYTPYDWLPDLQRAVSAAERGIALEIPPRLGDDPVSDIKSALIDIAIIAGQPDDDGVVLHELGRDPLVAVLPQHHILADREVLDPEDFRGLPYVTHHTRPERGREYEKIFTRHNILPKLILSAGLTEAVLQTVRAGLAVTIQPSRTIAPYAESWGLVVKPISLPDASIDWIAVTRPRDSARPAVKYILDRLHADF